MLISVKEAALLLERPIRTVRAQCASGVIKATRQGKQWRIDKSALPLTEVQAQRLGDRWQSVRQTIDAVLPPALPAPRPGPAPPASAEADADKRASRSSVFSVRQLETFSAGARAHALLSQLVSTQGGFPASVEITYLPQISLAAELLLCGLKQLAGGYFAFEGAHKGEQYELARRNLAHALVELSVLQELLLLQETVLPARPGASPAPAEALDSDLTSPRSPTKATLAAVIPLLEGPVLGGIGGLLARLGQSRNGKRRAASDQVPAKGTSA